MGFDKFTCVSVGAMMGILAVCHIMTPDHTVTNFYAETAILSHSTPTLHCVALLGAGYLAISYSLITASVKGPYARKDALRGMVLFLMAAAYVQYATPFEIQGPSSLIAMPLPIYAIWGSMAWRSLATMPEHRGGKDK